VARSRRSKGSRGRSKFAGDAHRSHRIDRERASRAAALKQKHALGYADAFAAELAIERGAWLVTADPEFQKIGKALSVYTLARREK
jgi:predicted nucleic acid-binding protein